LPAIFGIFPPWNTKPPINIGILYWSFSFLTSLCPAARLSSNVIEIRITSGLLFLIKLRIASVGIDVPILYTLNPLIERYVK